MKIMALKECLQEMETGKPFTVTFVKADRKRNTGGELKTYENCRLHYSRKDSPANHYQHSTRNVMLQNGEIRKIHIRLIVQFNNARVVY